MAALKIIAIPALAGSEKPPAATGTVTWVDAGTGYGFIAPDAGGADLFVDPTESGGAETLVVGTRVQFECRAGTKGRIAPRNVVLCARGPGDPGHGQQESDWSASP